MRIETDRLPTRWLVILATLVIALALSACSNDETAVPNAAATPTGSPAATAPQEPDPTGTTVEEGTPVPERPTTSPAPPAPTSPASTAPQEPVPTGPAVEEETPEPERPATTSAPPAPTIAPSPEPTATATPDPARPTAVMVSPATSELTALGATAQLRAEVRDQDSTAMTGVTVTWTTSASSVATVDAAGVVTATGNGRTTITASGGSASGSAVVTVTQEVASVEVSPSVAELAAWGETAQLTAEALDANGHPVAGAEFSWKSADVLVAEVDALGLVSGIGEGEATITASAGTASGSAAITIPPTFTLSGTVRDSRKNGPALAGAVVRLENGKRQSTTVGPDGSYRFPTVWGTVTVRVIAWPTHVTETVEIMVDGDHTLDFDLEHTGVPPSQGTVFYSPRIIEPSDPTTLESITYAGRGERLVYDQRPSPRWITINAYLFEVRYAGQEVEFRVNPEFGSREAAQVEVETYAHALGQIPAVLLPGIKYIDINAGLGRWSGNSDRGQIHIHTGEESGYMEESFVHEGAHVSLDLAHRDSSGWLAAQAADDVFISTYARDFPDREDIAESFLLYLAVRYQPERLTGDERAVILRTIPNRLIYFDEQGFHMSPYTLSQVQEPLGEIVTIQGEVVGPNNQPLEGILLWAWAGRTENSGNATTGEDGSFAIVVPDGSFTLDVYAPGEGCNFVGWHGPRGLTTVREDATRIEVDGKSVVDSVVDIVIRLPDHPDALPRIEWCA